MAAAVRLSISTGATPTLASAEGGIKYNREDSLAGTTPVPKPNAAGTNFSFHKNLHLEVTTADTTSLSNRRIRIGSAPSVGLRLYFLSASAYAQAALAAADNTTADDATPTGYTAMTTTDQVYDSASASAALGKNGNYARVALGVSNLYTGGGGSGIGLPSLTVSYDES